MQHDKSSDPDQTLVEKWNPSSTTWTKVTSDNMLDSDKTPDATNNELFGVSCNSTTNCWAVGWFGSHGPVDSWHSHGVGLGLHWNGTNGNFETVQIPSVPAPDTEYKLNAVSCVNDNLCVAVGVKDGKDDDDSAPVTVQDSTGDEAFIALWNGSTWEDTSPEEPNLNAEQRAELNGVSCVDGNHCMAVGTDDEHQPLAMESSGVDSLGNQNSKCAPNCAGESDTWFTVTSVQKGEFAELNAVSCVTANNCWAVGTFVDDHVDQSDTDPIDQALIEHWVGDGTHNGTGGNWELAAGLSGLSANQPSEVDNELNGIHCESATQCFAVGDFAFSQLDDTSDGVDQVLIDSFNGTSWSLAVAGSGPPANRTTDVLDNELQDNELNAVDCLDANNCAAVGEFDGQVAPVSTLDGPITSAPDETPAEDGTHTLVDMWTNPTPGSTPGTTGGTTVGTGSGTGSTPSTSVQAAKVPVPATGGGGSLPLILLAGAGVASLGAGITLIRSRKR